MTYIQLYKDITSLPSSMREEVKDFIDFLKSKKNYRNQIKERKFGCSKGMFIIHPDFDKPLTDFTEYM